MTKVDDFKWRGQQDMDDYELCLYGDDFPEGELSLTFSRDTLLNLHEQLGSYFAETIFEMSAARASYERGDGPNGEPRGTWEEDRDEGYEPGDPKRSDYLEAADALRDHLRSK